MREPLLRNVTPNEGKCHYHNSFSVEFIKKTQSVGEKTMLLLWWGKDCPIVMDAFVGRTYSRRRRTGATGSAAAAPAE